jgi:hypothetical protein
MPALEPVDLINVEWRAGTKVGRTLYAMVGKDDCLKDVLIGVMDTPQLAQAVVTTHNAWVTAMAHSRARHPSARRSL